MDIKSIILKKRNKEELDHDEIKYFIGKYLKGEITEAQAGALISYMYINGLTEDEIMNLAIEIGNSGDKLDLSDISTKIVDQHSTGGVGDKVTLILMPIIASFSSFRPTESVGDIVCCGCYALIVPGNTGSHRQARRQPPGFPEHGTTPKPTRERQRMSCR